MRKVLILLAGYPATGKSTFCKELLRRHPKLPVITPDDIKEQVWDEFGFDSAEEKAELEKVVWKRYYKKLEECMSRGEAFVSDYPFSDKQKPMLVKLVSRYDYHTITVRFVGDLAEIYKRSLKRDLSQERHLGHLMNHYHKGDYLADRTKADALVTRELLERRCVEKGYGSFVLGDLVEVDVTDIASVDETAVVDHVETLAKKYA
ncbi:MAG: AAA family ATPase [Atopobiaceae bacterium]|jgi:predicted kinase